METTATTGTGDIALAGAVTGYRTFNTAIGTVRSVGYVIVAVDGSGVPTGDWETGEGYLSATATLVRQFPAAGSAATPVSFIAGTKRVFGTLIGRGVADRGSVVAAYTKLAVIY
jgi:hypothetical protein